MNVSAVGTAAAASTSATSIGSAQAVDYQSFLRLLVAQMKNQDPTSPMESTDYVAQLATFSQVEQSVQMNNKLEAMLISSSLGQASGLIGRHVETMDGKASGVVKSVELYADGSVLVLENGTKVPLSASLIVKEAPAPGTDSDQPAA
jgi:flagellar basal-body rod modification protein FlgD